MHRGKLALLVERGLKSDIIQSIQGAPHTIDLPQNVIQHLGCNGIIKRSGWDGQRVVWGAGPKFTGFLKQLTEMEGRQGA